MSEASDSTAGAAPAAHCDTTIVQVVGEFGRAGGVENVVLELHHAFRRQGTKAKVMAAFSSCDDEDVNLVFSGLRWIPTRGSGRYWGRLLVVPLFAMAATRAIRSLGSECVIISHGDTFAGDLCVIHAVNKASLRIRRQTGRWRWILNPLHLWVALRDHWMIRGLRFRHYVAVSNQVVDDLMTLYGVPRERITVIANGVNLDRFNPELPDRAATRAAFGIPQEAVLLLFVGHEFERKGLMYVIEALGRLGPQVHLLVAGSDNPFSYRCLAGEMNVQTRVKFVGSGQYLPALYRSADLFVLPTYYETFALVCMEALACGLPILVTRVGGVEDYLEDGVNGYFIRRDANDVAAKVTAFLRGGASLRSHMRNSARATAEQYDWSRVAERYSDLVAKLALERRLMATASYGAPTAGR